MHIKKNFFFCKCYDKMRVAKVYDASRGLATPVVCTMYNTTILYYKYLKRLLYELNINNSHIF